MATHLVEQAEDDDRQQSSCVTEERQRQRHHNKTSSSSSSSCSRGLAQVVGSRGMRWRGSKWNPEWFLLLLLLLCRDIPCVAPAPAAAAFPSALPQLIGSTNSSASWPERGNHLSEDTATTSPLDQPGASAPAGGDGGHLGNSSVESEGEESRGQMSVALDLAHMPSSQAAATTVTQVVASLPVDIEIEQIEKDVQDMHQDFSAHMASASNIPTFPTDDTQIMSKFGSLDDVLASLGILESKSMTQNQGPSPPLPALSPQNLFDSLPESEMGLHSGLFDDGLLGSHMSPGASDMMVPPSHVIPPTLPNLYADNTLWSQVSGAQLTATTSTTAAPLRQAKSLAESHNAPVNFTFTSSMKASVTEFSHNPFQPTSGAFSPVLGTSRSPPRNVASGTKARRSQATRAPALAKKTRLPPFHELKKTRVSRSVFKEVPGRDGSFNYEIETDGNAQEYNPNYSIIPDNLADMDSWATSGNGQPVTARKKRFKSSSGGNGLPPKIPANAMQEQEVGHQQPGDAGLSQGPQPQQPFLNEQQSVLTYEQRRLEDFNQQVQQGLQRQQLAAKAQSQSMEANGGSGRRAPNLNFLDRMQAATPALASGLETYPAPLGSPTPQGFGEPMFKAPIPVRDYNNQKLGMDLGRETVGSPQVPPQQFRSQFVQQPLEQQRAASIGPIPQQQPFNMLPAGNAPQLFQPPWNPNMPYQYAQYPPQAPTRLMPHEFPSPQSLIGAEQSRPASANPYRGRGMSAALRQQIGPNQAAGALEALNRQQAGTPMPPPFTSFHRRPAQTFGGGVVGTRVQYAPSSYEMAVGRPDTPASAVRQPPPPYPQQQPFYPMQNANFITGGQQDYPTQQLGGPTFRSDVPGARTTLARGRGLQQTPSQAQLLLQLQHNQAIAAEQRRIQQGGSPSPRARSQRYPPSQQSLANYERGQQPVFQRQFAGPYPSIHLQQQQQTSIGRCGGGYPAGSPQYHHNQYRPNPQQPYYGAGQHFPSAQFYGQRVGDMERFAGAEPKAPTPAPSPCSQRQQHQLFTNRDGLETSPPSQPSQQAEATGGGVLGTGNQLPAQVQPGQQQPPGPLPSPSRSVQGGDAAATGPAASAPLYGSVQQVGGGSQIGPTSAAPVVSGLSPTQPHGCGLRGGQRAGQEAESGSGATKPQPEVISGGNSGLYRSGPGGSQSAIIGGLASPGRSGGGATQGPGRTSQGTSPGGFTFPIIGGSVDGTQSQPVGSPGGPGTRPVIHFQGDMGQAAGRREHFPSPDNGGNHPLLPAGTGSGASGGSTGYHHNHGGGVPSPVPPAAATLSVPSGGHGGREGGGGGGGGGEQQQGARQPRKHLPHHGGDMSFYTESELDAHHQRLLANTQTPQDQEFEKDSTILSWYLQRAKSQLRSRQGSSAHRQHLQQAQGGNPGDGRGSAPLQPAVLPTPVQQSDPGAAELPVSPTHSPNPGAHRAAALEQHSAEPAPVSPTAASPGRLPALPPSSPVVPTSSDAEAVAGSSPAGGVQPHANQNGLSPLRGAPASSPAPPPLPPPLHNPDVGTGTHAGLGGGGATGQAHG